VISLVAVVFGLADGLTGGCVVCKRQNTYITNRLTYRCQFCNILAFQTAFRHAEMRFQVSAECCESFARTDVRILYTHIVLFIQNHSVSQSAVTWNDTHL